MVALILATFLCSLVAGFLFAFAVVVMPGINALGDREFIRAFQVVDGVIQNGQPVFIMVWLGSVVALLLAAILAFGHFDTANRSVLVVATLAYVFLVQLPTIAINVPLNNKLQALTVDTMDGPGLAAARAAFEPRWNQWNRVRTFVSSGVTALLIFLVSGY